jgi:hypothetical protein
MTRKLKHLLLALVMALSIDIMARLAGAQSAPLIPIVAGCNAGDLLVLADANNLTCGPNLTVGVASGTPITQIKVYSQTITPASVNAAVCAAQTFTVTGLTTADKVIFNPVTTGNATAATQAKVSAADTLQVTYCNPTAGALTPAAGTATIVAFRS